MLISVFTPTYNRASLLQHAYESLQKQTFTDFEWIIVDDGSEDDTESVVSAFGLVGCGVVRYISKENGGKHTAINRGVKEAKGELFLILDSDDTLPADSLKIIAEEYSNANKNYRFGGVCGLMAHHDGSQIGSGFPTSPFIDNEINVRYKFGVTGDLLEVFRTSVMREFPFPEIKGERFCPEILVWNRIATKYNLHCFNKVVYYRDYLDGGLTDAIVKIRMNSPIATTTCYAELSRFDIPVSQKIKAAINYWRFRMCAPKSSVLPTIGMAYCWVLPIAWWMHRRDKKNNTSRK